MAAVVICPSNPFVSIDPIISLPGIRERLIALEVPVIAVSPIVGGKAIKGPTAKIMNELQMSLSAETVVQHYGALLNGFVLDQQDGHLAENIADHGVKVAVTNTVMSNLPDRIDLANAVLSFVASFATIPASNSVTTPSR